MINTFTSNILKQMVREAFLGKALQKLEFPIFCKALNKNRMVNDVEIKKGLNYCQLDFVKLDYLHHEVENGTEIHFIEIPSDAIIQEFSWFYRTDKFILTDKHIKTMSFWQADRFVDFVKKHGLKKAIKSFKELNKFTTITGEEFNKKYQNTIFLKILNRYGFHYNFQYKIGLNEIDNFHHTFECSSGGFYFCDFINVEKCYEEMKGVHTIELPELLKKEFENFNDYVKIHIIEIPNDAKVIELNGKYKTDKLILTEKTVELKDIKKMSHNYFTIMKQYNNSSTDDTPHEYQTQKQWNENYDTSNDFTIIPSKFRTNKIINHFMS